MYEINKIETIISTPKITKDIKDKTLLFRRSKKKFIKIFRVCTYIFFVMTATRIVSAQR